MSHAHKKTVRIAVYHNLPSGGAKRTLFETLKRLVKTQTVDVYALSSADESFCDVRPWGHKYQAFSFTPSPLYKSPFGRLNQLKRLRDLFRLQHLARDIAYQIDRERYDVVFVQPCMWTQAPLVLQFLKTPAVYYCHEPPRSLYEMPVRPPGDSATWRSALDQVDPLRWAYRWVARRLDWQATRSARSVLVNSHFMRNTVASIYGVSAHVCYHGIDADIFHVQPAVKRQDYVLSVGSIQPSKGFDFLVESIALLPEAIRPCLRLVGNIEVNGERRFLEELAKKKGVDLRIEVRVSEDTLVQRYREAALFAYAPYNEPFGLAPLEAMACGTPVLGIAEGGVLETVIDGVTGVLVRRNPQEWAAALSQLLADHPRRQELSERGLNDVATRWTWNASVARLEEHLHTVSNSAIH